MLAQAVRVIDDPRAEVIGILFRTAGAEDFRSGTVQPYIRHVDSAFAPFAGHAVFEEIRKLRAAHQGLRLSAVMSIVPQLTDPIGFGERAPFDSSASRLSPEWDGAEARPFLSQARDFARVANIQKFLNIEQPMFDSAAARFRRVVATARLEWIPAFWGEPAGAMIAAPLLISGAGNFGAQFGSGADHERWGFVSLTQTDGRGFPIIPEDAILTLVHELNHSFVNHVVAADSVKLRVSGERIFPLVRSQMGALAYDNWLTMYQESLVRAGVIRYLLATQGPAAAVRETRGQQGFGFVWMDRLSALLGEYEVNRGRYPTLSSFMPRIAAFYDSLAPHVNGVYAEFEQHRPRVLGASVADNDMTVDPGLHDIVIRFDRPVHGFRSLVGEYGGSVPTITSAQFDSTSTVLTLGVRLVPNHDYWLPFQPTVFADNMGGYPLVNWELRFRTRELPPRFSIGQEGLRMGLHPRMGR
jgi:hypothetical protein